MNLIQQDIVELVREYDAMTNDGRKAERGQAIAERLRLIGKTAAFFGGFDGMEKLHDAAEDIVGRDNSVGYWLNTLWDGIGGWWA